MFKSFNIRKKIYYLSDTIKRKNVSNHLKEINFILNNPESNKSKIIQKSNLNNILNHATNTTPFYKKFRNFDSILDFPVIKKLVIQDNFNEFQSYPHKDKNNFKVSTSGSTGVPFFLFQDEVKRNRNKADVLHFLKRSNYEVGHRLFYLGVRLNQKFSLKSLIQNVSLIDISKLTDKAIEDFLEKVAKDKNSNKILLGHVSAFETILKYLDRKNKDITNIKLNSIITNSEHLSVETKTKLENYFNTPALSRYSSEEAGIIAHQTIDSPDTFVVNHASYYIEVLNLNNNTPVKPGEIGRIVLTDLFNYAMPLIRYDTGDIAKTKVCDNGSIQFESVEGRKMDLVYDTQGNVLSSYVFNKIIYKHYKKIKQYQFIQQDKKEYEIKLNLQEDKFPFEKELISEVKEDFGKDANVNITYVNEIPPLASGKRRKVINNYNKNNSLINPALSKHESIT
ncbi:CoF synthetase [Algibacter marinivivus]|uniref:CoF synthetase n=1 Tax=Algibacter marinivivus TaxID=2100723 RepID=A0A2U2X3T8_9FLAO|nr:phenylacetate--CoA ligase family protein [Algibacter marinivivus]PWH82447.1 CoF synthetase [Algibacter marinivivus]